MLRNAYLLHLVKNTDMMFLNILEEVKLGHCQAMKIIKKYEDPKRCQKQTCADMLRVQQNKKLSEIITKMASSTFRSTDCKKIQLAIMRDPGGKVSIYKIRKTLIQNGFKWRKSQVIQPYVNSAINIAKRKVFAQQMIQLLESRYSIINVDETNFHENSNQAYNWIQPGSERRATWR